MRADLIYRPAGGADRVLGSVDSMTQMASFHLQPWINGFVCSGALTASPGDALVVRFSYVSGSAPFSVLATQLTLP